jgi:hypothetical protein
MGHVAVSLEDINEAVDSPRQEAIVMGVFQEFSDSWWH